MIFSPQAHAAALRSGIRWDEPDCPLCGGSGRRPVVEAPDTSRAGLGLWFAVVRCTDCGLCFTCPRPNEASIAQFYPSEYRPHRRPRHRPRAHWAPLAALLGRPCVERRVLPWHGQGRLLDFGCGGGSFLERMHRQGWHVTGLDASAETVRRVGAELGVPVLTGSLPHPDLEPGTFDVVTMWHSLEHVHHPLAILREAHRLLAPGGRVIVAVPNIDSAAFRWFGPAWFALDLPRHLTHFTPATLRAMLDRAGFRVARLRQIRHSDWLLSSAKLARRVGRPTFWQRQLARKPLAKVVAWASYVAGQSDCMLAAGEKAMDRG
jgi:2-polyprenyl-3-methyl-5-hydroxy-6-metoxy-1,4-benzoquinol methylase